MSEPQAASYGKEWDSDVYHKVSEPQFAWGLKLIETLALRGDETVLDAGCGSGRLTAELLKRLPQGRVIAADLSENMLRSARELLEPQFAEKVTFLHSDLRDLTIESGADVVFSAATFHWISERGRMFKRVFAALRSSGRLVAQSGAVGSLTRFWEIADVVCSGEPFAEHLAGFTRQQNYLDPDVTANELREAGFNDIDVSIHDAPVQFLNDGMFQQFIRTVNMKNHLERIPEALHERLLREISERSAAFDNPLQLDYRRINIRATRP
jgi:trans-aconitate 2-methyltransferase